MDNGDFFQKVISELQYLAAGAETMENDAGSSELIGIMIGKVERLGGAVEQKSLSFEEAREDFLALLTDFISCIEGKFN